MLPTSRSSAAPLAPGSSVWETFDAWLAGVTTVDGGDGLAAVRSAMGL